MNSESGCTSENTQFGARTNWIILVCIDNTEQDYCSRACNIRFIKLLYNAPTEH